jgi:WD40 repeat protein
MTEDDRQDALSLWNLITDKEELVAPAGSPSVSAAPEALDFSADGHFLAFANSDRGLTVYDLRTRQARRLDAGPVAFYGVALSADGRRLAASQAAQPRIWLWDIPSGTGEAEFATAGDDAVRLAFHPDGKTLLVSDLDNIIRFVNLASRRELLTVMNHSPMNTLFHVSPDGNSMALKASASMHAIGGVELWTAPPLAEIDRQISARR